MQSSVFRSWLASVRWAARLFMAALTLLTALSAPEAAVDIVGASRTAQLALAPCHLEALAEEVLCGVHEVYENRAAGSGRRIPIHVAVLPPLRRSAKPEPLFNLSGGPGQGARSFASVAARHFKQVRRTRAIVLVDLRGTGDSNPLECLREPDEMAAFGWGSDLYLGSAAACVTEIAADPRHYTHATALADLDEVRQRLGYAQINIWGGSWGTRAGMLYALSYPQAVRSVVLDGAVSFEIAFPRLVARNAQRAMDLLTERCAAEPTCASTFPNPRTELRALLARLDQGPITVTMRHPRTAARVPVTVTRAGVAEIVRVALYTLPDAARLLQTIRHAAQGDYAPLAAQYVHSASMSTDDMALGFTMSILCSEDLPLEEGNYGPDAHGTFLGSAYADAWRSRCGTWPAGPPIDVDHQATSDAPALILSGQYDPITPPPSGEAMGRRFPDHLHVVVPGAAHDASFTGCMPDLIATFLERGSTRLDTACAGAVPPPPIVVSDAGGRP
jgi:pimeloyl-ACP methyl ester carboxylesterase